MYLELRGNGRRGGGVAQRHISERVRFIGRKVLVVMCICAFMFLLRSIFWMWKPVTGEYSPAGTYPFFHYTLTGLIPNVVLFLVVAPPATRSGQVFDTQRSNTGSSGSRFVKSKGAATKHDELTVPAVAESIVDTCATSSSAAAESAVEEDGNVTMNPLDAV